MVKYLPAKVHAPSANDCLRMSTVSWRRPIRMRRRLIAAARQLADGGTTPPGVDDPEAFLVRSGLVTLPRDTDWLAAADALRDGWGVLPRLDKLMRRPRLRRMMLWQVAARGEAVGALARHQRVQVWVVDRGERLREERRRAR